MKMYKCIKCGKNHVRGKIFLDHQIYASGIWVEKKPEPRKVTPSIRETGESMPPSFLIAFPESRIPKKYKMTRKDRKIVLCQNPWI